MTMTLRKDSFASRLTAAQRVELFTDLKGGMTFGEAAKKVVALSVPKRLSAPTEQAICKWFKRAKTVHWLQEQINAEGGARNAAGSTADEKEAPGAADAETADATWRAVQRAKYFCVMDGLEPQQVAAFERNEIAKRRLDLAERKHEYAMLVADQKAALEEMRGALESKRGSGNAARGSEEVEAPSTKIQAPGKLQRERGIGIAERGSGEGADNVGDGEGSKLFNGLNPLNLRRDPAAGCGGTKAAPRASGRPNPPKATSNDDISSRHAPGPREVLGTIQGGIPQANRTISTRFGVGGRPDGAALMARSRQPDVAADANGEGCTGFFASPLRIPKAWRGRRGDAANRILPFGRTAGSRSHATERVGRMNHEARRQGAVSRQGEFVFSARIPESERSLRIRYAPACKNSCHCARGLRRVAHKTVAPKADYFTGPTFPALPGTTNSRS